MIDFIVLGLIPGTSFRLTFGSVLCLEVICAALVIIWRKLRYHDLQRSLWLLLISNKSLRNW